MPIILSTDSHSSHHMATAPAATPTWRSDSQISWLNCVCTTRRLPEELSGSGCFGTYILRVLAGSGHVLVWSAAGVALEGEGDDTVTETHAAQSACGCAHGSDPNALRLAVSRFNG